MTSPLPANTSQTARLILGGPSMAVGWQEPVPVPSPVAGAQWSHVADGRYFERLLAVRYTFTASAVVANRFVEVALKDTNGNVYTTVQGGWGVVASSFVVANLSVGVPVAASSAVGDTFGYLPDLLIPPGWSWGSAVAGMDAGDAFSAITMLVQRFPNDTAAMSVSG